jgi:adenosine deaminase
MTDASIPLVDLHRHLDGNLRLSTVLDLARRHGLRLPAGDVEGLRPHIQIREPEPDLRAFIAKVELMVSVLADEEACRRAACENVEDAYREGIAHVELRFSPFFMAHAHGLSPERVVAAVAEGVDEGVRAYPISVKLIGILSRTFGPEAATVELDAILAHREHITALDLAGDEARWPGELFVPHFRRGRDAGLRITVHAGEAAGAESVWQAIRELGAERLGHAVRAVEDPALLDHIGEHEIGIESCLTSNVQTRTVQSYESHPLAAFLKRGLAASINTDDPSVSGIDLAHELTVAAGAAGLNQTDVRKAQRNAVETAFLSRKEKERLLSSEGSRSHPRRP